MSIEEAARIIEALTGVPPAPGGKKTTRTTRQEKREQAERVKKFLSLPVPLQEGCLKYAQNIMDAYRSQEVP